MPFPLPLWVPVGQGIAAGLLETAAGMLARGRIRKQGSRDRPEGGAFVHEYLLEAIEWLARAAVVKATVERSEWCTTS